MNSKSDAETMLAFTKAACLTILCNYYDNAEDLIAVIRNYYVTHPSIEKKPLDEEKVIVFPNLKQ